MKPVSAQDLVSNESDAILWAPWKMLETEHDFLAKDLRRLENELEKTLASAGRLIHQFHVRMHPHFMAEEKAVFPYLRTHAPALSSHIRRLIVEHQLIRRAIADYKQSPSDSRRTLKVIRLLRNHVEKERHLMGRPVRRRAKSLSAAS
jgi:hemerythrin-like domain-containing protein